MPSALRSGDRYRELESSVIRDWNFMAINSPGHARSTKEQVSAGQVEVFKLPFEPVHEKWVNVTTPDKCSKFEMSSFQSLRISYHTEDSKKQPAVAWC